LDFPLEDASAGGGGFGLGDMAGVLQGDGERGVGERVRGREGGEREGCGDGGFQAAGVAESADEAVVGFDVRGIGIDGGAVGLGCLSRRAVGEQLKGALREGVGGGSVGGGHG